jgi:LDH2 family malate/lactate/ureidoglycolate dehydrogenase
MTMFDAQRLRTHVRSVFEAAGAEGAASSAVARVLVEGDLLGYHTHGVLLSRQYLADLRTGQATGRAVQVPRLTGTSSVGSLDCGHAFGPHVVEQALTVTEEAARTSGIGALALGRSHHIGCLAAYLSPMEHRDLITIIMSSNPARASVLPHGGLDPVMTPNPLAVRIPTEGDPIILDISTSSVTNGAVARAESLGQRLPFPVLLDAEGTLTDDPTGVLAPGPGGILPVGGPELGYKGFGLGLLVEALTSGLAGTGRRQHPEGLGASVFVLSLWAGGFAGGPALTEEAEFLARACRASTPRQAGTSVRLPGSEALKRKRERTIGGIPLPADALTALAAATESAGVAFDAGSLMVTPGRGAATRSNADRP